MSLPSIEECLERIADATHVAEHPDEYDVEVRVDAERSRNRWTLLHEFAVALDLAKQEAEEWESRYMELVSERGAQ